MLTKELSIKADVPCLCYMLISASQSHLHLCVSSPSEKTNFMLYITETCPGHAHTQDMNCCSLAPRSHRTGILGGTPVMEEMQRRIPLRFKLY